MAKKDKKKKKDKAKGGSRGRKKDTRSRKEKSKKKSKEAKGKKGSKAPKEKRAKGKKARELAARALSATRNGSSKVSPSEPFVRDAPVVEEFEDAPYFVDRSPIHGRGLFAATSIQEDDWIGTYEGPRTQADGTYVLWVEDGQGSLYGVRGQNELRYLNHSPQPNAEFDGEDLFAIRPIEEGAEITFDYGDEWSDFDD